MRHFDDATLWSGVYRSYFGGKPVKFKSLSDAACWQRLPTLVVTLRLRYWSLPLTISAGAHLLSKPGVTIGIGPLYFSWNWL